MNRLSKLTRVFYVVESEESDPELYLTYEDALTNAKDMKRRGDTKLEISIREVKNAFLEKYANNCWNYDDKSDTWKSVNTIKKLYK